jgi:hypothetical protein
VKNDDKEYANYFITEFGDTLLTELLHRHSELRPKKRSLIICQEMIQWTKEVVLPKIIGRFLELCTEEVVPRVTSVDDEAKMYALMSPEEVYTAVRGNIVRVDSLFLLYRVWRNVARFGRSDPTDLHTFTTQLGFFKPVMVTLEGVEYIEDLRTKQ